MQSYALTAGGGGGRTEMSTDGDHNLWHEQPGATF